MNRPPLPPAHTRKLEQVACENDAIRERVESARKEGDIARKDSENSNTRRKPVVRLGDSRAIFLEEKQCRGSEDTQRDLSLGTIDDDTRDSRRSSLNSLNVSRNEGSKVVEGMNPPRCPSEQSGQTIEPHPEPQPNREQPSQATLNLAEDTFGISLIPGGSREEPELPMPVILSPRSEARARNTWADVAEGIEFEIFSERLESRKTTEEDGRGTDPLSTQPDPSRRKSTSCALRTVDAEAAPSSRYNSALAMSPQTKSPDLRSEGQEAVVATSSLTSSRSFSAISRSAFLSTNALSPLQRQDAFLGLIKSLEPFLTAEAILLLRGTCRVLHGRTWQLNKQTRCAWMARKKRVAPELEWRQLLVDSKQPYSESANSFADSRQPSAELRLTMGETKPSGADAKLPLLESRQASADVRSAFDTMGKTSFESSLRSFRPTESAKSSFERSSKFAYSADVGRTNETTPSGSVGWEVPRMLTFSTLGGYEGQLIVDSLLVRLVSSLESGIRLNDGIMIDMAQCSLIRDSQLALLASEDYLFVPRLNKTVSAKLCGLNLAFCSQVTDSGLMALLAAHLPHLTFLSLKCIRSEKLTGEVITQGHLVHHLWPRLKHLNVDHTNFTLDAVRAVATHFASEQSVAKTSLSFVGSWASKVYLEQIGAKKLMRNLAMALNSGDPAKIYDLAQEADNEVRH